MPERRDPSEGTPRFAPLDRPLPGAPATPAGTIAHPDSPPAPACWQCGYTLSGLGVDGQCPECGTPIWSMPRRTRAQQETQKSASNCQLWGILSLVFMFACLGPLAAFMTIPSFVYASRAKQAIRTGLVRREEITGLAAGQVCSWITIGLTCLVLGLYGLMIMAAFVL